MHRCAEPTSTPPIPPRRKKRKVPIPPQHLEDFDEFTATVDPRKCEKRVAPPPPPPPPQASRRRKSRTAKTVLLESSASDSLTSNNLDDHQNYINNSCSTEYESQPESLDSVDVAILEPTEPENNNNNDAPESYDQLSNSCPIENSFPLYGSARKKEINKYPPLLFTRHDFENVIADAASRRESLKEELSRMPNPLPPVNSGSNSCNFASNDLFFNDNSLDDEDEGEVFFRVTTTSVPFEKCPDRWNGAFMGQDFVHMVDDSNHFVFEDYIDRSSRLNIRKSVGPMCYDVQEQEAPTLVHAATKVRFVIESPSPTTPDSEANEEETEQNQEENKSDEDCKPVGKELKPSEEQVNGDENKTILNEDKPDVREESRDIDSTLNELEETEWNGVTSAQLTEILRETAYPEEPEYPERSEYPEENESTKENECTEEIECPEEIEYPIDIEDHEENECDSSNDSSIDITEHDIDFPDADDFEEIPFGAVLHESNATMWAALDNQTWVSFACPSFGNSTAVITEITDPNFEEAFLSGKDVDWQENASSDEQESHEGISVAEIGRSDSYSMRWGSSDCAAPDADLFFSISTNVCENETPTAATVDDSAALEFVSDSIASSGERDTVSCAESDVTVIERDLINLSRKNSEIDAVKTEAPEDVIEAGTIVIESNLSTITVQEKRRILVSPSFQTFVSDEDKDFTDLEERQERFGAIDENAEIPACCAEDNADALRVDESNLTTKIEQVPEQWELQENVEETEVAFLPSDKQDSEVSAQNVVTETETARQKLAGVSVDIRRNSFLETMLSEDFANETWKIPKASALDSETPQIIPEFLSEEPAESDKKENELANRLNAAIKMDLEIQKILKESSERMEEVERAEKLFATSESIKPQKKVVNTSPKNAGEVKCDVLNELLINFSNIKLKPVTNPVSEVGNKIIQKPATNKAATKDETSPRNMIEEEKNLEINADHFAVTSDSTMQSADIDKLNNLQEEMEAPLIRDSDTTIQSIESDVSTSLAETNIDQHSGGSVPDQKESVTETTVDSLQTLETAIPTRSNTLFKAKLIMNPEDYSDDYPSLETTEHPKVLEEISGEQKSGDDYCHKTDKEVRENVPKHQSGKVETLKNEVTKEKEENTDSSNAGEESVGDGLDGRGGGSANSCAIVRNPESHSNNDDNNRAATPVAVSNDQTLDTVTIIPGSVRSFVKYYEIRREATIETDTRTSDREELTCNKSLRRSVSSIRQSWELKAKENELHNQRSTVSTRRPVSKKTEPNDRVNAGITKKPEMDNTEKGGERIKGALKETSTQGRVQSSGTRQKKSVQFQGGFTVIRSASSDEDDTIGKQSSESSSKKSIDKPVPEEVASEARVNFEDAACELTTGNSPCSSAGQETATQVRVTENCEDSQGISRLVPKSDIPRLVFYCTV